MSHKKFTSFMLVLLLANVVFMSVVDAFTAPLIWSGEILLTVDPTFTYEDDNGKNITIYFTPLDEFASIISAQNKDVWIAWQSEFPPENPDRFEVFYKVYKGYWTNATQLTNNPSRNNRTPALLQTSDGTVWIFWVSDRTGNNEVFYRTTSNYGASWTSEMQVTNDTRRDGNPAAAQTSDGKVWVVWSRQMNLTTEQILYKTFNGTGWSAENQLTATINVINQLPSIVQAADGKIWVFWSQNMTTTFHIFYRVFNGTGWSDLGQLTTDNRYNIDPTAFVERDGTIWVFWASKTQQAQASYDLYYKTSADNGATWSSSFQFTTNQENDWQPTATQTQDKGIWVIWTSTRDDPNGNPNEDLYQRITVLGDIDHNGAIDISDLGKISMALATDPYNWPHGTGWNEWNPECDLNLDNRVNILDMSIAAVNFGRTA
ncbi:MAG TPA: exo-alpha-sialidase [Candidatus Bathyarchaeia archaeon]|nr:exo-alpha-sialidase [Candidatus Bathyarchaeia archaeon]